MHVDVVVLPAIAKLATETSGHYRCERELHHHLTLCLHSAGELRIGHHDARVRYEHPTLAKYSWTSTDEKAGNVDFFLPSLESSGGVAIEANFQYRDTEKILIDFIKLMDPTNGYDEGVYFVYASSSSDFKELLQDGYQRALSWLYSHRSEFAAPDTLRVLLIEDQYRSRERTLWIGTPVDQRTTRPVIQWQPLNTIPIAPDTSLKTLFVPDELADELIGESEARSLVANAMQAARIPADSTTARCMFEATTDRNGTNRCKFGSTPLWDLEVTRVDGKVRRGELQRWIELLVASGQTHQNARQKAMTRQRQH